MIDWMSPAVIAQDALIYVKLSHVNMGVYFWEWFITLDFEWQYITGKKKFRWPIAFYFLNRYTLLFTLIGMCIIMNVTSEINCQALFTFNQFMGNFTVGLISINLAIRTMAVWGQRWYIVAPLILVILGHWSILMHGVLITSQWDPVAGCVVTSAKTTFLAAEYIYAMCFDFLVLILTAVGLQNSTTGRSRIGALIFTDGLVYFIVAFLVNVMAVTFIMLNLNPVMTIIVPAPATTAATIVTCRAVRRLANYTSKGAEVYHQHSDSTYGSRSKATKPSHQAISIASSHQGGVHIQMQKFEELDSPMVEVASQPDIKTHAVI